MQEPRPWSNPGRCGAGLLLALACNAYIRDALHLAKDMGGKIHAERESDGRSVHVRASNMELPARSQVGVDQDRQYVCRRDRCRTLDLHAFLLGVATLWSPTEKPKARRVCRLHVLVQPARPILRCLFPSAVQTPCHGSARSVVRGLTLPPPRLGPRPARRIERQRCPKTTCTRRSSSADSCQHSSEVRESSPLSR